jgi:hypothetical protein
MECHLFASACINERAHDSPCKAEPGWCINNVDLVSSFYIVPASCLSCALDELQHNACSSSVVACQAVVLVDAMLEGKQAASSTRQKSAVLSSMHSFFASTAHELAAECCTTKYYVDTPHLLHASMLMRDCQTAVRTCYSNSYSNSSYSPVTSAKVTPLTSSISID